MNTSRCALVLGLILAGSTVMPLWAADDTAPAGVPAVAPASVTAAREHYKKALDLYNQQKYPQASEEVDQALALNPNFKDAQLLRQLIDQKYTAPAGGGNGAGGSTSNRTLLTREEINRIKINELSENDFKTVRAQIKRADLEQFWNKVVMADPNPPPEVTKTKQGHDQFIAPANVAGQVALIRGEQAAEYYGKVNIISDPAALATYKTSVQTYIQATCTKCHGGKDNKGLPLVSPAGKDPTAVAYTNFYILSNLTVGGGKLIDRDNPEKSLLIQYAIDPQNATTPHPGKAKAARFGSIADTTPQALVTWIKSLRFPAPNYGVEYVIPTPPAKEAETVPAAPAAAGGTDKPAPADAPAKAAAPAIPEK